MPQLGLSDARPNRARRRCRDEDPIADRSRGRLRPRGPRRPRALRADRPIRPQGRPAARPCSRPPACCRPRWTGWPAEARSAVADKLPGHLGDRLPGGAPVATRVNGVEHAATDVSRALLLRPARIEHVVHDRARPRACRALPGSSRAHQLTPSRPGTRRPTTRIDDPAAGHQLGADHAGLHPLADRRRQVARLGQLDRDRRPVDQQQIVDEVGLDDGDRRRPARSPCRSAPS